MAMMIVALLISQPSMVRAAGQHTLNGDSWTFSTYTQGPLTLGVRMTTTADGSVTKVRFYKDPIFAGAHTVYVWNSLGTVLAQQVFQNETASGWQELTLNTPVLIAANSTFSVGFSLTDGGFVFNTGSIANRTSGPLTVVNGYYSLTPGSFPNLTNSFHYLIDLTFVAEDPTIPVNSLAPSVTGIARTGETLSASTGTWSGTPTAYAYQWKRSLTSNGSYSDIPTATSSTYLVPESDVGYYIKAAVVASNVAGSSSAVLSSQTSVVVDIAPTNTAIPVITGIARTGATLTASNGSWTGSPTSYTYQWKRAATSGGTYSNIGLATSRAYELTDTDIGKYIKVAVTAANGVGASTAELSTATSVVVDLTDSVVPTATSPIATSTGFTFSISNYSSSYTYVLTTTKGSVSRSTEDVTVTGLDAGESATVTISVSRTNYKSASKTVTGSANPATTTTTTAPALSIVIQAPVTTVATGQNSVATIAPTTTNVPVLGANGAPVPTTTTTTSTTIAPARSRTVVTTTLPAIVTTTTVGPPVVAKVDAGQTAVQVDGVKTAATVTRENNQMVVTSGALSATLSGIDKSGKTAPLDSDGTVHLSGGDTIKISLGGFKAASPVDVWLFSAPTRLGSAVVGADGAVTGEYRLPVGIKSGAHRVVISAKLPNGKPTTFTLGILVGDISTTSTLTRVLIAIPISIAIGFGFVLPTQLRRRRSKKYSHA
jgi:hypothetical protein